MGGGVDLWSVKYIGKNESTIISFRNYSYKIYIISGCPVVGAQLGMGQAAYTTTTWRRGCPSGSHRWLHNNIKLITQNIQLPGMKKKKILF